MVATSTRLRGLSVGGILAAAFCFGTFPARAQTIVDEWSSVKMPPAPQLKPVTIAPKTTAFLALDFITQICNQGKPDCLASLPIVAKALDQARSHNVLVVYSMTPVTNTTKDIQPQVAPKGDEPIVSSRADKFIGTDLEKILKDHGIQTVIVTGVNSEGAVLYTASHAAFLGMKVIVPVDGSSSYDAFHEAVPIWMLNNAPGVGAQTTLTSFDKIDW